MGELTTHALEMVGSTVDGLGSWMLQVSGSPGGKGQWHSLQISIVAHVPRRPLGDALGNNNLAILAF